MTNLAITMTRCGAAIEDSYRSFSESLRSPTFREREVFYIATLLVILQILDGIFTGVGVSIFGAHAEGNPLIRTLILSIGTVPALLIVKSAAIMVIFMLVKLSAEVKWVTPALRGVAGIYILAAILPWSGILINHFA